MPERGWRELSGEELLTRGAEARREIVAWLLREGVLVADGTTPRRRRLRSGSQLGGLDLINRVGAPYLQEVQATLLEDSVVGDAIFAGILQALDWQDIRTLLVPAAPIVVSAGRTEGVRVGVFNCSTDRDAFVEAMLGRPVPLRPRYSEAPPDEPVRLDEDLQDRLDRLGVSVRLAANLFQARPDELVRLIRNQARTLGATLAPDSASGHLAEAIMRRDPVGFAASPLGRLSLPALRGAPRWRSPSVRMEWAGTYDLGIAGNVGLALWFPGASELRRHRRRMAAHLRYLFDHIVAPWNTYPDTRARREGLMLWFLPRMMGILDEPGPITVPRVARNLRALVPEDYEAEPAPVTVRRMYRISARLSRLRTAHRASPLRS